MHRLGFPLAELDAEGTITIRKAADTGGRVDSQTVKEQLLYEVHDPAAYLTPDVVADISRVQVREVGENEVRVTDVQGSRRPDTLKANVFVQGGWFAEAEISYAGLQAEARALLAADIVRKRLGGSMKLRVDLIGAMSILGDDEGEMLAARRTEPSRDIRLRMAAAHEDRRVAESLLREMNALYTCGPAGGGGVRTSLKPRLNSISTTIPRALAPASWSFLP